MQPCPARFLRRTGPDLRAPDRGRRRLSTDYTIGTSLIYMTFGWDSVDAAYEAVFRLAGKHALGFSMSAPTWPKPGCRTAKAACISPMPTDALSSVQGKLVL
ncbi:hypothetical protein LP420_10145 [Massilia sp. B-10]|nr:hypothetical protein LP420_10145 [Massilia sp. B-10]